MTYIGDSRGAAQARYFAGRERHRTHDHNGRAIRANGQDHAYGIDRGTPETDDYKVSALAAITCNLRDRDREFAESMIRQYNRKRRLSPKQWPFIDRLIMTATNGYPEAATENVGDFTGVIALMGRAAKNLRHPKIRLQDAQGRPVVLSVAGARAKQPGTVNVTDGRPYGENEWYGRVNKDGTWTPSRVALHDDTIGELLASVAADPAGTAARHGKLTGNCCFCNRGLDDARSTKVGYGPTCARNFGLPWGNAS